MFVFFASYQGPKVSGAIQKLQAQPEKRSLRDDSLNVDAYVDQSLDIAYGFPSIVLTAVAYADLARHLDWINAVSLPVAVGVTLFLAWLASPRRVAVFLLTRVPFRRFWVSALSLFVLAANVLGLILALALPEVSSATD